MARDRLTTRTVAIWLGIFLLLALALRIGGNVGPSFDEETGRYLYSGNDPYYHDRVVRHITETGESMIHDPAINFPEGDLNPNPPFYDWTTQLVAGIVDATGAEDPVGLSLNIMVAVWGMLTVIPVFMIGSDLFGRRAGLWAAFLMAVSAPHIQRGVFGFADHDATTIFWITLALSFLIKALQSLDEREYVKDWRHMGALRTGLKESFTANKRAFTWSALAGVALSATALTWKGYPYVLAVMAVAVGLQLLWDHVKNRDSTAMFGVYLLPILMVSLIPLWYYTVFYDFFDTTILAGLYVLVGVLVVGAVLVPTRDLPSVLVFPALALATILGLLFMLFVRPDIGETIFTGLGYFKQTKLYTTIAEAQRSELGRVAASFGFFTFLLAFWAFGRSVKKGWKGEPAHMLMAAWGVVALFMAFAASRFIMNAAPVFAIFGGAAVALLVSKIGFENVRKRFRQQHGQNAFKAGMRSIDMKTGGSALLLALFIILPNLWLGVDASLPCEVDDCLNPDTKRFGAFGIDFDIKENGWLDAFNALAALDVESDMQDRPAFVAWWDYGHWATNLGHHPTVADPFQNHYNIAGRFIASESEQEGIAWLTILLINYDWHKDGAGYSPGVQAALLARDDSTAGEVSLLDLGPMRGYDAEFDIFRAHVDMAGQDVFALFEEVQEGSGKEIGYFAVDRRMYPFSSGNPGIFYAPSFLANKNPDDFIQFRYTGGVNLVVKQYEMDANGNSVRLDPPRIEDAAGNEYYVFGNQAYRADQAVTSDSQGIPVQDQLQPTQKFFNSMYARAFGHSQNGFTGGDSLSHWRVVHQSLRNDFPAVNLLEYYHGVEVSGRVVDDANQPVVGVQVTFVDGYGARHHTDTTRDDGSYTVIAPFSIDGDLNLTVLSAGTLLYTTDTYQFTRAQSDAGETVNNVDITVERGSIAGRAFRDLNADGMFNAGDTPIAAQVTMGTRTTTADANGMYSFTEVTPGSVSLTFVADGYNNSTQTVVVEAGSLATKNATMTAKASKVTFTLENNGNPLPTMPLSIEGIHYAKQSRTTNAEGEVTITLAPNTYNVTVDYSVSENGESVKYAANWTGTVPFGGADLAFTVQVSRTVV